MPVVRFDDRLAALLRCPRCHGPLRYQSRDIRCEDPSCGLAAEPFPVVHGQPVLVDFANSIFNKSPFLERDGELVIARDVQRRRLLTRMRRFLLGTNRVASAYARIMTDDMRKRAARPTLLVVGGGTVGSGIAELYEAPDLDIVSLDVFVSPHTTLVADGHRMPFQAGAFDGVWIQAVLEHVLNPAEVVAEIHRVLKPDGVVFADTPFMQQVHEGAYDFTRFTVSGHRWLFRHFALLGAGITGGPGTATVWSLRYLVRAVTGSNKLGTVASLAFFWLRFFDRFGARRGADAASGVYFYGSRAAAPIKPTEMPTFYEQQQAGVGTVRNPDPVGAGDAGSRAAKDLA